MDDLTTFPQIEKRADVIAVIGLHGAGKSTVVDALGAWLRSIGERVALPENVSLLPAHRAMKEIAIRRGFGDELEMLGPEVSKLCASLLKWNELEKARDSFETPDSFVVMDRCGYCQFAAAAQFEASNQPLIRELFEFIPVPDLTIYVDVSIDEALRRIDRRGTGSVRREFLQGLEDAYMGLPEADQFVHIDGELPPDQVFELARQQVVASFPRLERIEVGV
ncbi:MAG: dTMP kinase [Solirubrobacterales bacterium]